MPLDDLVGVIETLQQRIHVHYAIQTCGRMKFSTRVALIDPLLTALGWDVSDPGIVTPEYRTDVGWADYALRGPGNKPAAVVEAKRLGSFVENHLDQAVNYCIQQGIAYAAVTDGSHWQMYRTFDPLPLAEKRVLDVQISNMAAYECALKFLLLWRPNLATGNAVEPREPLFPPNPAPVPEPPVPLPIPHPSPDGWVSLDKFKPETGGKVPTLMRLPDGSEKPLRYWNNILLETAEYLIQTGQLTHAKCPIPAATGSRYVCHSVASHSDSKPFTHCRQLSNGLFVEVNGSAQSLVKIYTLSLLSHCGQDPAQVFVRID